MEVYLDLGRFQDIEALQDRLELNEFKDIRQLVSREHLGRLLRFYFRDEAPLHKALLPRAYDLRHLQRGAKMCDYFKVRAADRFSLKGMLSVAYHFHGKLDLALQSAEELLADKQFFGNPPDMNKQAMVVELISAILREQGHAELAQERIQRFLTGKLDVFQTFPSLLVERAAVHIALKQWDQAQEDLDALLRGEPKSYSLYVQVCLARGFLRQRQGDAAGAVRAWKQGLLKNYQNEQARFAKTSEGFAVLIGAPGLSYLGAIDSLYGSIVASLADDLSTEEADAVLQQLMNRISSEKSVMSLVKDRIPMPPGILRDMWRSPRGRECARKLAFQELTFAESTRLPLMVLGAEYLRQNAMPASMTAEQEKIAWMLGEQAYQAYLNEKLQAPQLLALILTWKGTTNFLGWGGVSSSLDPALRGPLAYVLGHRFALRLKQPAAALVFFQTAARDASPDSVLKRLALAEVERLQKLNAK